MIAAVFLSSCVEDEVVGEDFSCYQKITVEVPDFNEEVLSKSCVDVVSNSTGSTVILWQPNDKIGVYTQDGKEGNVPFTNTSKNLVAFTEFAGEMNGTPYYAYFPYSSENDGRAVTELKGSILTEQPYNLDDGTLVCDYKYGLSQTGNTKRFKFKQLFSLLRFTVDASGTSLEGERLNYVLLKVTDKNGNERAICGDFIYNGTNGDWTLTGNASGTITMPWTTKPTLANGKSYVGYINLLPQVQGGDTFYLEVVTEGHKASFTATIKSGYKAGYAYSVPLKLKTYAANVSKYGYTETEIDRPTITKFDFEVANNEGKLLNNKLVWSSSKHTPSFSDVSSYSATIDNDKNEISLTIPYLYDFKLKPTFTISSDNSKVLVNGVEQVSEETEVDFTKPVTYTVISSTGASRDYTVKVTNSGLPVVVVNQSTSGDFSKDYKDIGQAILGNYRNKFVDFWIRAKDTEWVTDDQITIYNADGTVDCDVTGGVRLRGNTSQDYPKKPFAMKFNSKKSVLGMPEHKRWVLLANWLDHSMIRNTVAFDIAHVIEYAWTANATIEPGIPWNVHGQNVELVFVENGTAHHVGNYYLCEQIKIDANRVNVQNGYLLELDNNLDEPLSFETTQGVPVMIKDEEDNAILNTVKEKIQSIETNIYNGNFEEAYKTLDINSVIDQFLIWELTMNREYGDPRSVYMFIDDNGKLSAGSVWDFDRGTFQNQENATSLGNSDRVKPDNEWMCWRTSENDNYIWYKQLIQDPIFQQTLQKRWEDIKPYLELIVDQIMYYGQSQALSYVYDSAMWPTNKADIQKHKSGFSDWSGDEQLGQNGKYQEVIDNFVTVFQERLAGMDALITSGKFTK